MRILLRNRREHHVQGDLINTRIRFALRRNDDENDRTEKQPRRHIGYIHVTDTRFADLGLAEPLNRALKAAGFNTPTPIQSQAIPIALEAHDVLGLAQTGTGKTAAFALPILHQLLATPQKPQGKSARALILAPTRELVVQIARNCKYQGHVCVNNWDNWRLLQLPSLLIEISEWGSS